MSIVRKQRISKYTEKSQFVQNVDSFSTYLFIFKLNLIKTHSTSFPFRGIKWTTWKEMTVRIGHTEKWNACRLPKAPCRWFALSCRLDRFCRPLSATRYTKLLHRLYHKVHGGFTRSRGAGVRSPAGGKANKERRLSSSSDDTFTCYSRQAAPSASWWQSGPWVYIRDAVVSLLHFCLLAHFESIWVFFFF